MGFSINGLLGAVRDFLTGGGTGLGGTSSGGYADPRRRDESRANEEATRRQYEERQVLAKLVGKNSAELKRTLQATANPASAVRPEASAHTHVVQARMAELEQELTDLKVRHDAALAEGRPDALVDGMIHKMRELSTEIERLRVIPDSAAGHERGTEAALIEEYLSLEEKIGKHVGFDALESGQAQANGELITRRDHIAALLAKLGTSVDQLSPEQLRARSAAGVGSGLLDALKPEVDPAAERFLRKFLADGYEGPEVRTHRLTRPENAAAATATAQELAQEVTAELLGLDLEHLPNNPEDGQLVAFKQLSEKYVSRATNWLQLSQQDPELARVQMMREIFKSPEAAQAMVGELKATVRLQGQMGRLPPDVRAALTEVANTGKLPPHVQKLLGERLQSPHFPPELRTALSVSFESGELAPELAVALRQSAGKGSLPPHLGRALKAALEQEDRLPSALSEQFRQALEEEQLPAELRAGMLLAPYLAKLPPELRQGLQDAVKTGELSVGLRDALKQAAQLGRLPPDLRSQVMGVVQSGQLPPELGAALQLGAQTGELSSPLQTALTQFSRGGDLPPQRLTQFNEFLDKSGEAYLNQWLTDYAATTSQPSREEALAYVMMRAQHDVIDPQTARLSLNSRSQPVGRAGSRERLGLLLNGRIQG